MNRFRRWVVPFSVLLLLFFFSCKKPQAVVQRAYYFWRTNDASDAERAFLKQHGVQKLYAHLLDVDWSEVYGAVPVAGNDIERINHHIWQYDSFAVDMVPVVFITNKTFERIDSAAIPELAKRIIRRCLPSYDDVDKRHEKKHYLHQYGGPLRPGELQFDCDWTEKTAARYFYFLREIKRLLPSDSIQISATIRLHQFRYPEKTGVPPVSRGMLMVYNLSSPKQYGAGNSIFDEKKASPYFTRPKKYPLPLDIALPAWSWCLIFRNQQLYQIENGLSEKDLQKLSFLKPAGKHIYTVTKDTVYRELFLRPGDEIKAEGISEATLKDAARLAKGAVNTDAFSVSLFELSEKEFENYNRETIHQVYDTFR